MKLLCFNEPFLKQIIGIDKGLSMIIFIKSKIYNIIFFTDINRIFCNLDVKHRNSKVI